MANGTLKVENIQTSSGSGTITLGQSGETIALGSGVTSKVNEPYFEVTLASQQNISDATQTTIQFDTTVFDTGSFWDSTNYRWLPTVAGKYYVYAQANLGSDTVDTILASLMRIEKNGSRHSQSQFDNQNNDLTSQTHTMATIVELNGTSDYIDVSGYIDVNAGTPSFSASDKTRFGAYRIG